MPARPAFAPPGAFRTARALPWASVQKHLRGPRDLCVARCLWRQQSDEEGPPKAIQTEQPDSKPNRVFVLGGPGSGKGTLCAQLALQLGACHLSAGELLREEAKSDTDVGRSIRSLMERGEIVPAEVTIGALSRAMRENSGKGSYLIDGFPRRLFDARSFEDVAGLPTRVLFLDAPLEVLQRRLLLRAETSGRSDDKLETMRRRFEVFEAESLPVIERYAALELLSRVDASRSRQDVLADALAALRPLLGAGAPA
eukprot:tig00020556_g11003.t1